MSISKKIRFEVFKRDGFQCGYCGKTPPGVVLEVDHIDPKSKGGKDGLDNLITACFDCNRGKRDIPLEKIPQQVCDNLEVLQEKELQIKEYRKFVKKIERRLQADIAEINAVYTESYKNRVFTDQFNNVSIRKFLSLLPKHEIIDSLRMAISKFSGRSLKDRNMIISYFCGICWNKIKGKGFNGKQSN